MIRAKRTAAGVYSVTARGRRYIVEDVGGCVTGYRGWVWHAEGESADDVHATKRDALAALADHLGEVSA